MQQITERRLKNLAEQMLKIIRNDETILDDDIPSICVDKTGYMSVTTKDHSTWHCAGSASWHRVVNGVYEYDVYAYECFDCKHCGSEGASGDCICKKDLSITSFNNKACSHFEEDFHE